jgi:hypothetical protein
MRSACIAILPLAVFTFGLDAASPKSDYWQMAARASDIYVINSGSLKSHFPDLESSVRNKYYYYSIPVLETLKGAAVDTVKVTVFLDQGFIDYIRLLPDNTLLIIFLRSLYNKYGVAGDDEFNNYFITRYDRGIITYSDTAHKGIAEEASNQYVILRGKLYETFQKDPAMDYKIRALIDKLTDRQNELAAFDELIALGPEAVPYIILYMDDFRELPIKHVRLTADSPDAWEEHVYYGPYLVIDMLAIALSELTKTNFGFISNGDDATAQTRQRALDGWRIYLYYLADNF